MICYVVLCYVLSYVRLRNVTLGYVITVKLL